jgi:hypothetical protein
LDCHEDADKYMFGRHRHLGDVSLEADQVENDIEGEGGLVRKIHRAYEQHRVCEHARVQTQKDPFIRGTSDASTVAGEWSYSSEHPDAPDVQNKNNSDGLTDQASAPMANSFHPSTDGCITRFGHGPSPEQVAPRKIADDTASAEPDFETALFRQEPLQGNQASSAAPVENRESDSQQVLFERSDVSRRTSTWHK